MINLSEHLGLFKTFKEARKHAREVARYQAYKKAYISKTTKGYIVKDKNDGVFDFFVHMDGRVCKKENIEKENKRWHRHPERHNYATPFLSNPRNRDKDENKKEYKKKMAINGRCPY